MKLIRDRVEFSLFMMVGALVISLTWLPAVYWRERLLGRVDEQCSQDAFLHSVAREQARLVESDARARSSHVIETESDLLLWHTPAGSFWIPEGSSRELARALAGRLMFPRWQVIEGHDQPPIRSGDVVIDCGAHVGQSTLAALQMGARFVLTVEPDTKNLVCLRRNLAEHIASGKVVVVPAGVSDVQTTATIVRGVESSHTHTATGRGERHDDIPPTGDTVLLTTIDVLVAQHKLPRVDFIKMDIEGSEVGAVRGAVKTIKSFRPRMALATYHTARDLSGVPEAVRAIRTDYEVQPSRCLPYRGLTIPNLLYFF